MNVFRQSSSIQRFVKSEIQESTQASTRRRKNPRLRNQPIWKRSTPAKPKEEVVLLAVDQEAAHVRDQYSEVSVPDLDAWRKQIQTLETYFAGNEAKSQAMRWLTRLRLLEAVPFQYLVPAEEMLPTETIRFFHIDRNWVDALIDGAMSVTLTSTREKQWLLQDDDGQARYVSIMSELS